jgi:OmpA family
VLLFLPVVLFSLRQHTQMASFIATLSGQRADGVRTFLVSQGLNPGDVTSSGMGEADPVAGNDTAAGRQQNRRVEIIVFGEAIGTKIGG